MASTLRSSRDIRAVLAARQAAHGRALGVHARRSDSAAGPDLGRAAVVAGRRVGGAVARNRAKRRIRAALERHGVPPGLDVVVVAKAEAVTAPFPALEREYVTLCSRLTARLGADGVSGAGGPRTGGAARGPGSLAAQLLVALVQAYRLVPKPGPPRCRFEPSCSAYALEALRVHGSARGVWLSVRRVARCHPFNAGGVDCVPSPTVQAGRIRPTVKGLGRV